MSLCIPRKLMPQVDQADYPDLLAFLCGKGCAPVLTLIPLSQLTIRQCMSETRPATNPLLLKKPLLIAKDLSVLDGNHRLLQRKAAGIPDAECEQLPLDFQAAYDLILSFPKAYRYADGPQPYRI